MDATHHRAPSPISRRLLAGLLLAGTLVPWAAGPAMPVYAEEPIIRDHRAPTARVWLNIKSITVHDDLDSGDGEIDLRVRLRANKVTCQPAQGDDCGHALVESTIPRFSASDDTVHQIGRLVPTRGDSILDPRISPELGIGVRPDEWYGFSVSGTESDPIYDDDMGQLRVSITDENGQVRYGTFTERAVRGSICQHNPTGGTTCTPPRAGAFSVEYEIARANLPDLQISSLDVDDVPGADQKRICAAVKNAGTGASGAFELAVRVDGASQPNAHVSSGGLEVGRGTDMCVVATVAGLGQHQLTATIDSTNTVAELNETNNVYEQAYQSAGAADMTVRAIKVRDQIPDGKDDCKPGKNDVSAVVKNGGAASAGAFVVGLTVDGQHVADANVVSLDPGQELEVRFDDVRLKKGSRALQAEADKTSAVSESNESNNTLKVTATCKNDD